MQKTTVQENEGEGGGTYYKTKTQEISRFQILEAGRMSTLNRKRTSFQVNFRAMHASRRVTVSGEALPDSAEACRELSPTGPRASVDTGQMPTFVDNTSHVLLGQSVPDSFSVFEKRDHQVSDTEMKRWFIISSVVAAGLLAQQLSVVAVAQERPERAVGRVLGTQSAAGDLGTPAIKSQVGPWDGLGKPGTATTNPGGADGTGNPAFGGERRPLYRLRKSDLLEIGFTFSPEFNQTVSVQPDGYIRLKELGDVYAEGQTLHELEATLHSAYAPTLHDPEVTVALRDFDKPYFIASGEVGHPGKYELRSDTTISEAVAIAGGFTQQARHSQVLLFRRVTDDLVEARVLNIKKMRNGHQLGEDPHLRPGDFLYVPQSRVSKIRRYLPVPSMGMYLNGSQF